jgi:hypothetical protein
MHTRLDHADWCADVWILNAILGLWMGASGWESMSSRRLQRSSHICVLERNPEAWSNTECRPDVLLKRPDKCKLEQFKTSRHRGRFGQEVLVVRTNDALNRWASGRYHTSSRWLELWTDGRSDGMTHRPGS